MDENTKKRVLEIIKKCIDETVYDEVKQIPARLQAKQEELNKTKSQKNQDAHDALFGKDDEEMSYKLHLHEIEENPKITPDELIQFEKDFKSRFPGISFDKQIGYGQNGQIVNFPMINGQKDAVASGKINIGQEIIGFSMSLIDGLKIKSVSNDGFQKGFEINKETKDVFGKLLNLYEEVFKQRFNEIINPNEDSSADTSTLGVAPDVAPTATMPAPAPAAAI